MQTLTNENISKAIITGLKVLSDENLKIRLGEYNDLAVLRILLKSFIDGELTIAEPKKDIPEVQSHKETKETISE